jgi:pyrimidine-nucleoside phosphorylase
MTDFREVIRAAAEGRAPTRAMMEMVARGAADGSVPDYQLAAWLMAVYCQGLSDEAVYWLTDAMARSGGSPPPIHGGLIDKHSTGGVGDKTTLVVAPLVACLGLPVAKMSGRGLGHTGGTLDKLESIPGFETGLAQDAMADVVARAGVAVVAQTAELAPADGHLYALRDATSTVESLPLIAASIMSKKIAGGSPALVLDVKVGRGGFMPTQAHARDLAGVMLSIARRAGLRATALLTNMDQPLGRAVGNAIEVNEAVDTLEGRGPEDFQTLVKAVAAAMLEVAGLGDKLVEVEAALADGRALGQFRRWIEAQGGDTRWLDEPDRRLPLAPMVREVASTDRDRGFVHAVEPRTIGQAALELGAGRRLKTDPVDHAVGIEVAAKVGDPVEPGTILARMFGRREEQLDRAETFVRSAFATAPEGVRAPAVVIERLSE